MGDLSAAPTFQQMWQELLPVGRDGRTGGYRRFAWDDADRQCREWFEAQAQSRGMDVETDRNGNQWAWWGDADAGDALVLGSHLDSVPDGGAYDGPLGVVSAYATVDALRAAGVTPTRPLAVTSFADEEGARFGIACTGSRLLTGSLDPDTARGLRDREGQTLAEVLAGAGRDPAYLGRDDAMLARIGTFVELHVEQGRALVDHGEPVGVASAIWPHGRWRFDFTGQANHAGTALMEDRRDPMLTYAMTALAANKQARLAGARATFGRVEVRPNATNAIPSRVLAWLDARAADPSVLSELVDVVARRAVDRAARDGTAVEVSAESETGAVVFEEGLRDRLTATLGGVPVLSTGAGHDAGVLAAAGVESAMLFVRNPTGVSHSPYEHAELDDCLAGVAALTSVVTHLGASGAA